MHGLIEYIQLSTTNLYHCAWRALTTEGSITVQLVSSLTGLDTTKKDNFLLILHSKVPQHKPAKLDTSCVYSEGYIVPKVIVLQQTRFKPTSVTKIAHYNHTNYVTLLGRQTPQGCQIEQIGLILIVDQVKSETFHFETTTTPGCYLTPMDTTSVTRC